MATIMPRLPRLGRTKIGKADDPDLKYLWILGYYGSLEVEMTAPLKVDDETDRLATHGAHFLGMTKKQFVAEAVRAYTEARRVEIEQGARDALAFLDGSRERAGRRPSGST